MEPAGLQPDPPDLPAPIRAALAAHRLWIYSNGHEGTRADFRDRDLRDLDLTDVNLSGADLSGADLRGARLHRARFLLATMSNAHLDGSSVIEARFDGATLDRVVFDRARLIASRFDPIVLVAEDGITTIGVRAVRLAEARFRQTVISGVSFRDADLRDVNLQEAKLSDCNFEGARLGQKSQEKVWESGSRVAKPSPVPPPTRLPTGNFSPDLSRGLPKR